MVSKGLWSSIELFSVPYKDLSLSSVSTMEANGTFGFPLDKSSYYQSANSHMNLPIRFITCCFWKAIQYKKTSVRITWGRKLEMHRLRGSIWWELLGEKKWGGSKSIFEVDKAHNSPEIWISHLFSNSCKNWSLPKARGGNSSKECH